jgi:protocatechuate 3,4-dioxygenase beta subunit
MTDHDHDRGLVHDLTVLADSAARRRAILKWGLGLGALPLFACAGQNLGDANTAAGTAGQGNAGQAGAGATTTTGNDGACTTIPEETAGPYPGDDTNGQNALALSGIVRSDIRSSIAGASGVATGVLLTVTLTIVDTKDGCAPLAGQAVYIWHCDQTGNYSMYAASVANENYLRGVQETDENGQVTFTTIFPGCYSGRWPHIHFEVYSSLASATNGHNAIATSQLALPEATCKEVYATTGYEASVSNLAGVSLATDMVFSDGAASETPATSGSAQAGYLATLTVGV